MASQSISVLLTAALLFFARLGLAVPAGTWQISQLTLDRVLGFSFVSFTITEDTGATTTCAGSLYNIVVQNINCANTAYSFNVYKNDMISYNMIIAVGRPYGQYGSVVRQASFNLPAPNTVPGMTCTNVTCPSNWSCSHCGGGSFITTGYSTYNAYPVW